MIVAVQPTIAWKICRVASSAACMRECPSRRKRAMFSTTTIESSTSRPSATTKPAIEIWLSEKPEKYSTDRPIASDSGIEIITTPAARSPSGSSVIATSAIAMPKSVRQPVEARRDVLGLIEAELELDALRQLLLEALHGRDDALAHFEDVVAVLLVRGDEHGALAVEAADVRVFLRIPAHVGDVAHAHAAAIGDGHDRVAYFVERLVAAGGLETESAAADVDGAAGNVRVLALQRLHHLARWRVCSSAMRGRSSATRSSRAGYAQVSAVRTPSSVLSVSFRSRA